MLGKGKNPKQIPPSPHYLLLHLGGLFCKLISMADADGTRLNFGFPTAPRGHGRPRGNKNEIAPAAIGSLSSAPVKRCPGRPVGSKNKPKVPRPIPGLSAPPGHTSTPQARIYIFFVLLARSTVKFSGCR
jgi:hypothetical protein